REEVEELPVAGGIAAQAEIARRRDQAPPKVLQPDAVRPDARRERVLGARDAVRQLEASAAVREGRPRRAGQEPDELARNLLALVGGVAAAEDTRIDKLR